MEREIVEAHRKRGIEAERIPLSGSAGGSFTGDVVIAGRLRGEVKARSTGAGFAALERWLGENDVLFLRRDRAEPMIVLPSRVWFGLLDRAGLASGNDVVPSEGTARPGIRATADCPLERRRGRPASIAHRGGLF